MFSHFRNNSGESRNNSVSWELSDEKLEAYSKSHPSLRGNLPKFQDLLGPSVNYFIAGALERMPVANFTRCPPGLCMYKSSNFAAFVLFDYDEN